MKLIVGAGGTGGHIIPAIAVALEMSNRNWDIVFIGNKSSLEEKISTQNNFAFLPINVQKIYRKLTLKHIKFPFLLVKSFVQCLSYMSKQKPDAVICTGGFVSGPVAAAAALMRIPLYFQDGNSYPGLTTRMMAKHTRHVFIASEAAKKYLSGASCIITGNPLLKHTTLSDYQIDYDSLNLRADTIKLFVIGGSQGSVAINQAVADCVEQILAQNIEIIWQTGKSHFKQISSRFLNVKGLHIFDFTDKMNLYYSMADMAISRAGALSIAELEEYHIPSIFIPLPIAAENHQYQNAVTQQTKGVGIIIEQKNLSSAKLLESLGKMLEHLTSMKEVLLGLPENQATRDICDIISQEAMQNKE